MTVKKKDAREQAKAGRGGNVPPVDKRFGAPNGNKQHNGAWKKESTPRYKIEKLLEADTVELGKYANDKDNFSSTVARVLIRLRNASKGENINVTELDKILGSLERLTNQVYGAPKQTVETTVKEVLPLAPKPKKSKKADK